MLVLYSDGVTEANNVNYDEYGEERFIEVLCRHRHEPAAKIIEAVNKSLARIHGWSSSGGRHHAGRRQARLTLTAPDAAGPMLRPGTLNSTDRRSGPRYTVPSFRRTCTTWSPSCWRCASAESNWCRRCLCSRWCRWWTGDMPVLRSDRLGGVIGGVECGRAEVGAVGGSARVDRPVAAGDRVAVEILWRKLREIGQRGVAIAQSRAAGYGGRGRTRQGAPRTAAAQPPRQVVAGIVGREQIQTRGGRSTTPSPAGVPRPIRASCEAPDCPPPRRRVCKCRASWS